MATIAEKMAESLEILKQLQQQGGCVVLKGTIQIPRIHLNRLLQNGWLVEVMRGWYIASRPGLESDNFRRVHKWNVYNQLSGVFKEGEQKVSY